MDAAKHTEIEPWAKSFHQTRKVFDHESVKGFDALEAIALFRKID